MKHLPQNRHQRRFEIKAFQFMDLSTRKYLNEEATTQTRSEAWFGKTSRWFTCFSLQTDLLHVLHWSVLALWVTLHRDLLRWKGECVQNLCIFTQMFMIYYSDLLYFYCLPADVICCPFFFVISLNKAQVNHWQWECVNFFISIFAQCSFWQALKTKAYNCPGMQIYQGPKSWCPRTTVHILSLNKYV